MKTVNKWGLMEAVVEHITDTQRLYPEQKAGYHWPVEILGECGLMEAGLELITAEATLETVEGLWSNTLSGVV